MILHWEQIGSEFNRNAGSSLFPGGKSDTFGDAVEHKIHLLQSGGRINRNYTVAFDQESAGGTGLKITEFAGLVKNRSDCAIVEFNCLNSAGVG